MVQIGNHRWEYDNALSAYRCVTPRVDDVQSADACPGCGVIVTDIRLARFFDFKEPGTLLTSALNLLANNPGVCDV